MFWKLAFWVEEFFYTQKQKGTAMKGYEKYTTQFYNPPVITMDWAKKDHIEKAPIWCSVDLRDGNQALVIPMSLEEKIEYYKTLLKVGFKEIEVGFPAASETEYEFCRTLIEQDLIPDDVTIQVLTQAREHIVKKTFEALEGCKHAIVHLYNSTSVAQREQVFHKDKEQIKQLAVDGELLDLLLVLVEDLLTLCNGGGVIKMHNGMFAAFQRLKCLLHDVLPGLGQDLDGDVVRNKILLNKRAAELILCLAGSRESDLNLFEADFQEGFIVFNLLLQAHGDDKRLVAVAEIDAAPDGCFFNMIFFRPVHSDDRRIVKLCCIFFVAFHSGSFLLLGIKKLFYPKCQFPEHFWIKETKFIIPRYHSFWYCYTHSVHVQQHDSL